MISLNKIKGNPFPNLPEEDDGARGGGGNVEGSVEISLRGCSLTEIAHHTVLLSRALDGICSSRGLGQLGSKRRRDGLEMQGLGTVVDRHLTTLAQIHVVRVALVHELIQSESTVQQGSGLTVLYFHSGLRQV